MSLTVADQQFIKRALDVQCDTWNEAFDKNIVELTKALAEVVQAQNNKMFSVLEEQCALIREIQSDIKEIKQSIEHLNLEIKDIRLEIKAIKVDVKGISIEVENLTNRMKDHDFRLGHLEKTVGV
jgi:chromosome segregation ATPase